MSTPANEDRFGGTASILVGVSYLVVGITYVLSPAAQQASSDPDATLRSFIEDGRTMFLIGNWALVVGAVIAFAAVPAITRLVDRAGSAVTVWASRLAYFGFGVAGLEFARNATYGPDLGLLYAGAQNLNDKFTIRESFQHMGLDPRQIFVFGLVGVWLFVLGARARRSGTLPKPLWWLATLGGLFYWIIPAGNILDQDMLVTIGAAGGGIVVGPIFYIWAGMRARAGAPG